MRRHESSFGIPKFMPIFPCESRTLLSNRHVLILTRFLLDMFGMAGNQKGSENGRRRPNPRFYANAVSLALKFDISWFNGVSGSEK